MKTNYSKAKRLWEEAEVHDYIIAPKELSVKLKNNFELEIQFEGQEHELTGYLKEQFLRKLKMPLSFFKYLCSTVPSTFFNEDDLQELVLHLLHERKRDLKISTIDFDKSKPKLWRIVSPNFSYLKDNEILEIVEKNINGPVTPKVRVFSLERCSYEFLFPETKVQIDGDEATTGLYLITSNAGLSSIKLKGYVHILTGDNKHIGLIEQIQNEFSFFRRTHYMKDTEKWKSLLSLYVKGAIENCRKVSRRLVESITRAKEIEIEDEKKFVEDFRKFFKLPKKFLADKELSSLWDVVKEISIASEDPVEREELQTVAARAASWDVDFINAIVCGGEKVVKM